MNHIKQFNLFESITNLPEGRIRSERLLTQAQLEYPNIHRVFENEQYGFPTIAFTDIVGSSELWSEDPVEMINQLQSHYDLVNKTAKEYGGWIVKSIGDAFMLYFEPSHDSLVKAIKCCKDIITDEKKYKLRIGVCQGNVNEKSYEIQNVQLRDFYGNAVNSASRLESRIAKSGFIAFSREDRTLGQKFSSFIEKMTGHECQEVKMDNYDLKGAKLDQAFVVKVK
jgi:class 3 adenylate cyclase